jgi:murein DD-endopeptidase MepM/ murein hydrolase activator NlpD
MRREMTRRTPRCILLSIALASLAPTACATPEATTPAPYGSGPMATATVRPPPAPTTITAATTAAPTTATTPPTTAAVLQTAAPNEVIHVFPIDPPDAASYAPGGHAYPATDLFAPEGTRFVAVTPGVIEGVSRLDTWDPEVDDGATRAGLFVSLIGDDGVRYYGSHLGRIAAGIEAGLRVDAGQLLGYVGRSGNARDTPPHLHFGISRPTFLGDWQVRRGEIDPVPLLDAWRAGETTATPDV